MKLSSQEKAMAEYLEKYHDINNPISMTNLSELFGISKRMTRRAIERIIITQTLVIGIDVNNKGYWVANSPTDIEVANNLSKSRLRKTLKRLAANKGDIKWIYNYLKELENKYPKYHNNQLTMSIDDQVSEVQ